MVTWFGMDCNIYTNPKVLKFADGAKLDADAAVGKLGRLYAWAALSGNEDGEISHLPNEEIAAIMRWKKKPDALISLLLECGLLDELDGRRRIHDWDKLNGNFLRKNRKDRERKK